MEYVFGTKGDAEILKTKGDVHSNLTGFCQIEMDYPDQHVTDNFRVVSKYDTAEDAEGNCYDWYEIDRHFRTVDKTPALDAKLAGENALLRAQIQALTDQNDFQEELIVELAGVVYA